jgi:hypothetical protein
MLYQMAMYQFCLDTNCLIALENNEASGSAVRNLVKLAELGKVHLSTLGISASENQIGGGQLKNFAEFKDRLHKLGMGHLTLLKPIAIWDVTFWDWCVGASDDDEKLLDRIHSLLFPGIDAGWPAFAAHSKTDQNDLDSKTYRKWINAHCDAQVAWACINYKQDALITSNTRDFQNKAVEFSKIGLKWILTPENALSELRAPPHPA